MMYLEAAWGPRPPRQILTQWDSSRIRVGITSGMVLGPTNADTPTNVGPQHFTVVAVDPGMGMHLRLASKTMVLDGFGIWKEM